MKVRLNQEQLERVHAEIYGIGTSDSAISIQLQKQDRYIQEHQGRVSKPIHLISLNMMSMHEF